MYIVHIVYCYTSLLVHVYSSYCILLYLFTCVSILFILYIVIPLCLFIYTVHIVYCYYQQRQVAATAAAAAATAVAVVVYIFTINAICILRTLMKQESLHFFTRAECTSNLSVPVFRSTLQSLCYHYFCYISAACMYVDLISGYSNVDLDTARCTLIT